MPIPTDSELTPIPDILSVNFEPIPTEPQPTSGGLVPGPGGAISKTGDNKSANYVPGQSGWIIKSNGDVEFNDGTFRGALVAASIDIPDLLSTDSFHVDSLGNMWLGVDASASPTSAPAYILKDGSGKFTNIIVTGSSTIGATRLATTIGAAINSSGDFINDLINARLNTSAQTILAGFDFGSSNYAGAVKAGNITWNTSTGAITGGSGIVVYRKGIVGANAGTVTFSIDATTGNATFAGNITSSTITASAITGNSITGGTITGATITSTAGGSNRIVLTTGDTLEFYTSSILRGTFSGVNNTRGTGVKLTGGDLVIDNDKSVWFAASPTGASTYGGISITSANEMWLTVGTANTFFIKSNNQATNLFTVGSTGRAFSAVNGYLVGAGMNSSANPINDGLRIYVVYTDSITLTSLGGSSAGTLTYTSANSGIYNTFHGSAYQAMPTNTMWVGMTIETIGTPRVVCQTWNYQSGSFQWNIENFHTANVSVVVRFCIVGY